MSRIPAGEASLAPAAEVLAGDGVVVLPTDTVYGVAVRADRPGAAAALAAVKGRAPEQAVAVLVGGLDQVERAAVVGPDARALAGALWPGPLTLVLVRRAGVDWDLGEPGGTVGARWPDDRFVAALARRVGPLAVTSANRHGEPTPVEARAAAVSLSGPVDLVVDGGIRQAAPSTVVDLTGPEPRFLRAGAVPEARVTELLARR